MVTGSQIRAARSALRMSISDLAILSGVSVPTIQRFEQADGMPPSRSSTLNAVQKALESQGIEFIGAPEDRPGIRIGKSRASANF
jgi:DNA-binding transcriptional regulator YiaG